MAGHSQGIMAVESLRAKGAKDAELLALLQLIGAAGSLVSRRRGMVGRGDKSPMVSVTNVDPDRIAELLEEFSQDVRTVLPPVLSIRNGRRSVVITGTPEQLAASSSTAARSPRRKRPSARTRSAAARCSRPVFHGVQVEVGFHTPRLADAVDARRPLGREVRHRRRTGARDGRGHLRAPDRLGRPRSSACTTPARSGSSTWARATP